MTDIQPLPPEMLASEVGEFLRDLPVASVQVEDHTGVKEYAPPAQDAPQSAPEDDGSVVVPPWAQSPREGDQAPVGHAPEPHGVSFNQPGPVVGRATVTEDDHGVQIGITFNQPTEVARDLTIEERVEWLEEELAKVSRRLQSTLEANNLWDGS